MKYRCPRELRITKSTNLATIFSLQFKFRKPRHMNSSCLKTTYNLILKQLDYWLSISMRDS